MKKRILPGGLALILSLFLSCMAADADEAATAITITASVLHTGGPVTEAHTIRMSADNDAFPMPGGKTGGTCDITIEGEGTAAFPDMQFDHAGTYTYTIYQLPGDSSLAVSYDASIYVLRVRAREADGDLKIVALLYQKDNEKKADTAAFTNVYSSVEELNENPVPGVEPDSGSETKTIPKTGDASGMEFWLAVWCMSFGIFLITIRRKIRN